MRAKNRLQRQLSLNKVLFASGFLFLLFLLFFVVFPLLFFLFVFWRSVFLLRVLSQVCLFFGGLRILTASNLLPFLCVCTLSWALVFSLCLPSSLPCSFSFGLSFSYSQLHVVAEASVSCLLILDIPRAAVTQKETSSMWLTVRAGTREGGGMRGCVCRPFNVMKETHTGEHMT